jgi:D-galactarolactone cycloisomerase
MTKVGGIGEMKKIAVLAASANVTFVPHSFYFGPGLAATLHVVASTQGVPYVEMPPGQLSAPLLATPIRFANGAVHVPEGPGLGADPDPDVFRRHAYTREAARPFYLT